MLWIDYCGEAKHDDGDPEDGCGDGFVHIFNCVNILWLYASLLNVNIQCIVMIVCYKKFHGFLKFALKHGRI